MDHTVSKKAKQFALDDVFISASDLIPSTPHRSPIGDHASEQRGKIFEELRNVKVLRSRYGLEMKFVDLLRTSTVNPPLAQEVGPDATRMIFGVADLY